MLELTYISIKQQKKKIILLFIQFFVGFFALFYSISMIENLLQYKEQLKKIAPLDMLQILDYSTCDVSDYDIYADKYNKCIEDIKKLESVEKVGLFEKGYFEVYDSKELYQGIITYQDYLDIINIDLCKGTVEPLIEYKGQQEEVPILVTMAMSKKYTLNSTIKMKKADSDNEFITYKIVGIIDDDSKYFSGNSIPIADSIKKCDTDFFICPSEESCMNIESFQYNTVITKLDSYSSEIVAEQICDIYSNNNIYIDLLSLDEQIKEYYKGQKTFVITVACFSIILLSLSVLGCIGTLLASIMQRKEEFGIYIAMGFTKRKLMQLVLSEILLLFLGAFTFATIGCSCLLCCMSLVTNVTMNGRILLIGLICMMLCAACSVMLPLIKVNKLQPIELIEERE